MNFHRTSKPSRSITDLKICDLCEGYLNYHSHSFTGYSLFDTIRIYLVVIDHFRFKAPEYIEFVFSSYLRFICFDVMKNLNLISISGCFKNYFSSLKLQQQAPDYHFHLPAHSSLKSFFLPECQSYPRSKSL